MSRGQLVDHEVGSIQLALKHEQHLRKRWVLQIATRQYSQVPALQRWVLRCLAPPTCLAPVTHELPVFQKAKSATSSAVTSRVGLNQWSPTEMSSRYKGELSTSVAETNFGALSPIGLRLTACESEEVSKIMLPKESCVDAVYARATRQCITLGCPEQEHDDIYRLRPKDVISISTQTTTELGSIATVN